MGGIGECTFGNYAGCVEWCDASVWDRHVQERRKQWCSVHTGRHRYRSLYCGFWLLEIWKEDQTA